VDRLHHLSQTCDYALSDVRAFCTGRLAAVPALIGFERAIVILSHAALRGSSTPD
jgi:hypothetical protein